MTRIFGLFLGIKGRINFLQLERFSDMDEQSFRNQFEIKFDFLTFNKNLILELESCCVIAFDPSFISKSGKKTPGLGYFWSGTASKSKWGLEIGGIAAVDIENHTAFHLEAIQTLNNKVEAQSLLENYANILIERKEPLQEISKYVVVDAYFSKKSFIEPMKSNGFEIVSRLRDDSHLIYDLEPTQTKTRGRPRKYGQKAGNSHLKSRISD